MTDKTEAEIVADVDEDFERRAAADDPAGFVPHRRPPGDRTRVYSVRIPADALETLRRLADARGQPPSVLMRTWVLERLRQETSGEELRVSRDELARIVREQLETVLREAS
ncbi:MAG: ribbon-helix-helix protein, CopG family [Nocardioidaceae bacterium]